MAKTLERVLLIDDDSACNFFNRRLLKNRGSSIQVQEARNGREALTLVKQAAENNQLPHLVFLDLNMPVMSGWEFLNEFKKLPEAQKQQTVIIVLSSSINPDDQARAKSYPEVAGYKIKYLSDESLGQIIEEHFGKD